MSTQSALALANCLATTQRWDGDYSDYDAYCADVFGRWPDLTDSEILWAIQSALNISEHEAKRLEQEADELRRRS